MNSLPDHDVSCTMFDAAWPALCEAMWRKAQHVGLHRAAADHLATCAACAAEFVDLLALVRWREAQEPFNRNSLPLSARREPALGPGGIPGERSIF